MQGAQTLQTLGSRTTQLTELVANTNATTAAIASQSQNLEQALRQLGPTLTHSTATFAGLRSTLDVLQPLVVKSIPNSRHLAQFVQQLGKFTIASIPTVSSLNDLIRNPTGNGDLITLLQATPGLANIAESAFPRMIKEFNDSQPQVDYFREYTPDVVAALSDLGQTGGYYDANGHYARTQPFFGAFAVDRRQPVDRPSPVAALRGAAGGEFSLSGRGRAAGARRLVPVAGPGLQQPERSARAMRRVATILVLMLVASAVTAVITTSSTGKTPTYEIRAIFDDAAFAVPGEDVRVAGAPVGSIQSLDVCTKAPCPQGTPLNKAAVTITDRQRPLRAVLRQRALRDPTAVADRREVRRLSARVLVVAAAAEDHERRRQGLVSAAA